MEHVFSPVDQWICSELWGNDPHFTEGQQRKTAWLAASTYVYPEQVIAMDLKLEFHISLCFNLLEVFQISIITIECAEFIKILAKF